ncbi:MAG: hypothetical protein ABEJ03_05970 [Candidatus Nanohaloarchaea archaeon]
MKSSTGKLSFLVALSVLLVSFSAAAWNIDVLDDPYTQDSISNMTETVRLVNLTKDGSMVDQSELENDYSDLNFTYRYNATDEPAYVEHLQKGYWYASFEANYSRGHHVEFQLRDEKGSIGLDEINTTENMSTGNYSLELEKSIPDELDPGSQIEVRVNLTDEWNDEPEKNADVDVYFTNVTDTLEIQDLGNRDGSVYYNSGVNVPDSVGSTYVLHINATNITDQSMERPNGSMSRVVQTAPPLQGYIDEMKAFGGCNNSSFFQECEAGAEVEIDLNSTGEAISSINFTVRKHEKNSGEVVNTSYSVTDSGSYYEASFDFPELNTSRYDREVELIFNASRDNDRMIKSRNVTYRSFELSDASDNRVDQGESFSLRLSPEKPFSGSALSLENFSDVNVSLEYQNGSEFKFIGTDSMQNYPDSGFVGSDVSIPLSAPNETYTLKANVTDDYGFERNLETNFEVEKTQNIFDVNSSIDIQLMDLLPHNTSIMIENLKSSKLELEIIPQDNLEGITQVNTSVNVSADSSKRLNVSFDPEEPGDIKGDLLVNDTESDAESAVDVELDSQDCERINGSLCVDSREWRNRTLDSSGSVQEFFTVKHQRDGNISVDITESGDTGEVFEVEPASFELEESRTIQINYSARKQGNFTAMYEVEGDGYSLPVRVALESNAEPPEASASVPSTLDLGSVTSGDDVTQPVSVTNTGDFEIYSIEATSPTFTVSASNLTILPGGTRTVDLSFDSVTSGSGTITLEMATPGGSITRSISASTALSTPPEQNQTQQEDSPFQDDNGTDTGTGESDAGTGSETGTGAGSETGETEGTTGTGTGEGSVTGGETSENTSGSILLPIIAAVLVFLVIGFVFYTSYIPEEGDPLYSVMGEE